MFGEKKSTETKDVTYDMENNKVNPLMVWFSIKT